MKRGYWRILLLFWFTASMSIANAHVHHDLHEHEECVKCFAHDHMGSADLNIVEAATFEPLLFEYTNDALIEWEEAFFISPYNPRAPPFSA